MTDAELWKTLAMGMYLLTALALLMAAYVPSKPRSQAECDARNLRQTHPAYGIIMLMMSLLAPVTLIFGIIFLMRSFRNGID